MRVFRHYVCDFGHQWDFVREKGEARHEGEAVCPDGHPAVTCTEEEPADEVQILIRPAVRIADRVTDRRVLEGKYWLVLLDREGVELRSSARTYTWDEAVKLAQLFRGKPAAEAIIWWDRRKA